MKIYLGIIITFISSLSIAQSMGYKDDFEDGTISPVITEVDYDFGLEETDGELLAFMNGNGPGWGNIDFTFASTVNFSNDPIVRFSIMASSDVTIRFDLKDADGNVARGDNGLEVDLIGGVQYYDLEVDFSSRLGDVDEARMKTIVMFFNPGGNYSGVAYIDQISLGDPEAVTNFTYHINQVGYERTGVKTVLLNSLESAISYATFELVNANDDVVFTGDIVENGQVQGWGGNKYWTCDFSDFMQSGEFKVKIGTSKSLSFKIGDNLLFEESAASVINFFTEMRSDNASDYNLSFNGSRSDGVDVHGGWWDANGDPGKHMSHLSYANHFNPQQIPMVVWSLLKSYELTLDFNASVKYDLLAEAAFGADYMVRNFDDEGYFYLSIFDDWGGAPNTREICEWGQEGDNAARTSDYKCAFREGGGMIIAALARSYYMGLSGDFTNQEYLSTAELAYAHLTSSGNGFETKNLEYCNDHKENIIDDYCALMAAVELYRATLKKSYYDDALVRADKLLARLQPEGWLASDDDANRPFYHAADEGLPLIALVAFKNISAERDSEIIDFINNQIEWYKGISSNVVNPFNYVRQYRKAYKDGQLQDVKEAFFIPHDNETGYWWQGENARLASMSTAFLLASRELDNDFNNTASDVAKLATSQLDWILGKNPFDLCMLYGFGLNNYIDYPSSAGKLNIVGGICNGISAGLVDEDSLTFQPYADDAWQNWRWIEQWLPHDAWYMLAISSVAHLNGTSGHNIDFDVEISDDCSQLTGEYSFSETVNDFVWSIDGITSDDNTPSLTLQEEKSVSSSLYIRNEYGSNVQTKTTDFKFSTQCITATSEFGETIKINSNPFINGLSLSTSQELQYTFITISGLEVEHGQVQSGQLIGESLQGGVYLLTLSGVSGLHTFEVVKL